MSGPCALPLPSLQPTYSVQCDGSGSSPDAFREGQWALGEPCHAGILWFCDLESESHVWSYGCVVSRQDIFKPFIYVGIALLLMMIIGGLIVWIVCHRALHEKSA